MATKKDEGQDFAEALAGKASCPECGGPMPSPIQVTVMQPGGIPKSYYVCRHCHRQRNKRVRVQADIREGEPAGPGPGGWLQMQLAVL